MSYWSKYENDLLFKLKDESKCTYKEIQEAFREDPQCQIRSLDSIASHYLKGAKPKSQSIIKYDEILNELRKTPVSVSDLENLYGMNQNQIEQLVIDLNRESIPVTHEHGFLRLPMFKNRANVSFDDQVAEVHNEEIEDPYDVRIAIISDTHFGSKSCDISSIHQFYTYAKTQGVKHVVHAGDLTDGIKVYPGQTYEQNELGFEGQMNITVNEYPKNGLKTYVIGGNHDYSFMSNSYTDIMNGICNKRNDIVNCGYYQGTVIINNIKIKLHHPDGGMSYALSYKLQKMLETNDSLKGYDIFVMGHYHQSFIMHNYVVPLAMMPGSFQRDTPFSKRKGLKNIIGGYIVRIKTSRITKTREYITQWIDLH